MYTYATNRVYNDIKSQGRGVILKCKSFNTIATRLNHCLAENIHSFIMKLGQNSVENQNKACDCDEIEVHLRINFTAGKDSVGRFPSPQDHRVKTLMLYRSYWKRMRGQKDRESSEWKRKRLKRWWPWFATLGEFTKYGEQMFNVFSYLSGRAERLQSDQSFCTRWLHLWQPCTLFKYLETNDQLRRRRSSETHL